MIEDGAALALALYAKLAERPGNLCFSPLSIRVALAMAAAGARGETATQMDALQPGAPLETGLAPILARLHGVDRGDVELAVVNSMWCQSGASLEAGFREVVTGSYGGEIRSLDFHVDPERARAAINREVAAQTREKIRDLVPAGALDADTRLVLANAIHFLGRWLSEFSPELTSDEQFHRERGGPVKAPSMQQTGVFRHLQAEGFQAVELDYRSRLVTMLVLLPDRRDGLQQLEARLSAKLLHDSAAQMESRKVRLLLPRFEIRSGSLDLADALRGLGMSDAFERTKADFSGINGLRPPDEDALFMSHVFHQAFALVNETGTEAAAATAATFPLVGSARNPPPPAVFRADHPFVFAIRERTSDAILFLGRVEDPTRAR